MAAFQRIVCPVDFSEFARHALDYAVAIARPNRAAVTALYVVPPVQTTYPMIGVGAYVPYVYTVEDLQQFRNVLERFVADVGYPVEAVSVEAPVVDEILRRAAEMPADVVVMGTHGRSGFDRLLLGSVTERVVAKASCPVLTIPRRAPEAVPFTEPLFQHVLCPIDFSPSAVAALELAETLAAAGASLRVLYVAERLPSFQLVPEVGTGQADDPLQVVQRARQRVRNAIPDAVRRRSRVEEIVSEGHAAEEILRIAGDGDTDLIIMGAHGGHAGLLGFGSTTNHVIRGAACPVMTLKA